VFLKTPERLSRPDLPRFWIALQYRNRARERKDQKQRNSEDRRRMEQKGCIRFAAAAPPAIYDHRRKEHREADGTLGKNDQPAQQPKERRQQPNPRPSVRGLIGLV